MGFIYMIVAYHATGIFHSIFGILAAISLIVSLIEHIRSQQ